MRKKTAEYLKCRVIDYLLQIYPDIIIGNEVMFGYKEMLPIYLLYPIAKSLPLK